MRDNNTLRENEHNEQINEITQQEKAIIADFL